MPFRRWDGGFPGQAISKICLKNFASDSLGGGDAAVRARRKLFKLFTQAQTWPELQGSSGLKSSCCLGLLREGMIGLLLNRTHQKISRFDLES
jgi:hypothetical protein